MGWLYDMLISSGVQSVAASWCVGAICVILVWALVKAVLSIFD